MLHVRCARPGVFLPTDQDEIEKLAALVLAPLVEVAWADGHVTPAEREGVMAAARALGLDQRSEFCRSSLLRWLHEGPPEKAREDWRRLLAQMLATSQSRPALKARKRLLREAVKIAKMDEPPFEEGASVDAQAGISEEERRVLDELASALESIETPTS